MSECQKDSVDADFIAADMSALQKIPKDSNVSCIFNAEETGLFYKGQSRQTCMCKNKDPNSMRGTMAIKSKGPVAAQVYRNAIDARLPMCPISNPKNPK